MKFIIPKEFERTKVAKYVTESGHEINIDKMLDFITHFVGKRKKADASELGLLKQEICAAKWFIDTMMSIIIENEKDNEL